MGSNAIGSSIHWLFRRCIQCFSLCYQPVQYHKYPVPLNLQPHGQQQICLSIILFQKRFHTGDTGTNTGIIKLVRHGTIFAKFPETIYSTTNFKTLLILMIKLEQIFSAIVTPGITHFWWSRITPRKWYHNTVEG